MFSVFYKFFNCLFSYTFFINIKKRNVFKKLIGVSFNVPEKHRYKFKTVISGIKKMYTLPVINLPQIDEGVEIVYDLSKNSKDDRLNYLNDFSNKKEYRQFISADQFMGYSSAFQKIAFLILSLPVQLVLIILGLIKKDRSGIHSILCNLLITQQIISIVKPAKPFLFVLFSIYDTNSSFLAYNLQKKIVTVKSVTSEVPLYKWNELVLTDVLHICSEYQLTEIKHLPGISYKTIEIGAPEKYFEVKEKYLHPAIPNNKLGFISTGGWIRKKLGHIDQGADIEKFENQILSDLNLILSKKTQIELIIYPHPREVKYYNNSFADLHQHYKQTLPDINFQINTSGKQTNKLFNETYLSICFMTTTIFERLHAKRMSAIVYFKENIFPVEFVSDYLKFISTTDELEKYIQKVYSL
jgi:hypothetical protein